MPKIPLQSTGNSVLIIYYPLIFRSLVLQWSTTSILLGITPVLRPRKWQDGLDIWEGKSPLCPFLSVLAPNQLGICQLSSLTALYTPSLWGIFPFPNGAVFNPCQNQPKVWFAKPNPPHRSAFLPPSLTHTMTIASCSSDSTCMAHFGRPVRVPGLQTYFSSPLPFPPPSP